MTRISIVEDRMEISTGLQRVIAKRKDIKIVNCYDSAEAALIGIPGSPTEIVLMDIGLPKMNGIECLVRLKEKVTGIDFLMFTIYDADEQLFTALRYGASGYILKSDGIRGVIKAIEELISGGAPMSKTVARKVLSSFRPEIKAPQNIEILTPKQNEVLQLLSEGLFNYEIADRMGIVTGTVSQHLHTIFKKLHVNNRVEARNKFLSS